MKRFTNKKQNKNVKAFLKKVCRFCGQEYDTKVPLPSYNHLVEDEECEKVERVTKMPLHLPNNDKMPQNMCSSCATKIDGHHQFIQTFANSEARIRNQLGLDPKSPSVETNRKEEGKVLFSVPFQSSNVKTIDSPGEKSNDVKKTEGVPIFSIPIKSLNDDSSSSDDEKDEAAALVDSLPMMSMKLDDAHIDAKNAITSDNKEKVATASEVLILKMSTNSDDEKKEAAASSSGVMKSLKKN